MHRLWSSRVCFTAKGLHPSLQWEQDTNWGWKGGGGCSESLHAWISAGSHQPPRAFERDTAHIHKRSEEHSAHTQRTHKPADTNIGTVSQHLRASRLCFFLFICFVMDTFRHRACTQTRSWKLASLHSLSPTAFLPLSRLHAKELLCNSSCFQPFR